MFFPFPVTEYVKYPINQDNWVSMLIEIPIFSNGSSKWKVPILDDSI